MMARLDAEDFARIRALVEDGKIPVGSAAHLSVIQMEMNLKNITRRDKQIIRLSIQGLSNREIGERVGLSRRRVAEIVQQFFKGDG